MRGKTDKEQLEYATNQKRVILTRNIKHIVNLQREYFENSLPHNKIRDRSKSVTFCKTY